MENIKGITDVDLIFNVRSIIATGGVMDANERMMVSELIDRFEDASERIERLNRYICMNERRSKANLSLNG